MGFFDIFRKKERSPVTDATVAPASGADEDLGSAVTASYPSIPATVATTHPAVRATGGEWVSPKEAPSGLPAVISHHAKLAYERGLTPHVYFSAVWAPPCNAIRSLKDDPRMLRAFANVYVIELDDTGRGSSLGTEIGRYSGVVQHTVGMPTYPSFYEVDARGELTGRTINGSAWGADTVENMAPALARYFHRS